MNKLNRIIPKYLVFASPAVAIMFVWGFFQNQQEILALNNKLVDYVWTALAFHLMFWLAVSIYFIFLLLLSPGFRDEFLAKLIRIKERDERERSIIGKAGRFCFLSTLALLVFLLFFSTINISVTRLPKDKANTEKQHSLSLSVGMSFFAFNKNDDKNEPNKALGTNTFSTQGVLFSNQAMLLLLIIWHLGTFYYISRKYQKPCGTTKG